MAYNQTEYITGYIKENYDRVEIRLPKGNKNKLRELAVSLNIRDVKGKISVNQLF